MNTDQRPNEGIPGPLWVAIIALAVMIIGKLAFIPKTGPIILVDAFLSAILLFGILWGQKWAFVFTILFVIIGVIRAFAAGLPNAVLIIAADLLVLIPVLFSTHYFFPKSAQPNGG